MTNEFWDSVEDAYTETVRMPEDQRAAFLHENYSDRPDLQREVESLLQFQPAASRLAQSTVFSAAIQMLKEDSHDLIGSVVADKYFIRQYLGGKMGEVYLADHITLNTPFALKRPSQELKKDPTYRQRLLDEGKRAVILKHDNVARVHDIIESGDDVFLVMEYIEGETLRARLEARRGKAFSTAEFLSVAIQCASALAASQQSRIVHLDVKPENIMLTQAGQVKICDFGVARKLSPAAGKDTTVAEAQWKFAGTPAYMAPEVILSYQFDERADQFSLGTVFYEMLTGRNPFLAETIVATTAHVVKTHPPAISASNPEVEPRIERIVMRLLSKEPEQRYASAADLVEELEAVRRARERVRNIVAGLRELVSERSWTIVVAAVLLLAAVGIPARWLLRGVEPLPDKKVVVVLPIRFIGDSSGTPYSDGLTETLTASLSQIPGLPKLDVVPTSAVWANGTTTPEEARKHFAANLAIVASIEKLDEALRINVALLDTLRFKQLRSTSFTIPQLNHIAIQNQIAEASLRLLEIHLATEQQSFLTAQGTHNANAYGSYVEGMGHLANRNEADHLERAIQSFRQAIALDWTFGPAYAGLGQAYWAQHTVEKDPQAPLIGRAQEACERAVSLNSNLAAGYICLGTIDNNTGNYERAVEEFSRAQDLEPNNADVYRGLARSHERLNNWEAAEAAYLKAIQVRPSYWYSYVWLGQFYLFSRQQYSQAIDTYQKAVERAPENTEPYLGLCGAYIFAAQYPDAIQACNRAIELKPSASAYISLGVSYWDLYNYPEAAQAFENAVKLSPRYYKAVGHLARAYSWIPEKRAESPALYRKAIELADEELRINPQNPNVNVMVARYHAMLGHRVEATSHFQLALSLRPKDAEYQEIGAVIYNQFGETNVAFGYLERALIAGYSIGEIATERELDNLRKDSRFLALIKN